MADAANPLDIIMLKNGEGEEEAYIPLRHLSEDEVERLRADNLQASTVDSTAEEMGDAPPGAKAAEEQLADEMESALENPIDDSPSPADAMG